MSSLAKAIETGDLTQLPSRRDEDWRWTDLRGLLRTLPPTPGPTEVTTEGPFAALGGDLFLVPNGFVEGFTHIEGGSDSPVAQLRFVAAEAGSIATRVLVVVRAGQTLTLLESHEALADGAVSDIALDIEVAEGGRLERIVLAADRAESVTVSTATVTLAPGASYAQTILTSGARRQRIETHVAHPGQGASVRLDGAYLLQDQRHADTTSVVTHSGLGGVTSQLTKGVVDGQARGVFQGRIVVERGADQTDARMGHHALILSDKAEIDAKPELLIFADDVQCAHGNTVGALDEDALFYSQQRGMPFETARAMLTEAFVGEVVDRIEHEGAREIAAAWVAQQLGRGQ
jgi:Fe-S cluster assembly protein SufD